ncbi:MAG: hypothetical protein AB1644_13650 [Candidatus Zixiibacteriota bacterium]
MTLFAQSTPVIYDTIATSCLRLVVGTNGNVGHMGEGKVNMDYWDFGDCDTVDSIPGETDVYLFDGSPIIIDRKDDTTLVGSWSVFGEGPDSTYGFKPIIDTIPPIFSHTNVTTSSYQRIESGQLLTSDSSLAVEITWWAPRTGDSCEFIVQFMRIFPSDGRSHIGVTVGQLVDWNVPSDTDAVNRGGFNDRVVYQSGFEYVSQVGLECQKNDRRFGGIALMEWKTESLVALDYCCLRTDVHGGYTAANDHFVDSASGLIFDSLMTRVFSIGFYISEPPGDAHSVLTFMTNYKLPSNDTMLVYSVFASIRNGTSQILQSAVDKAKHWYAQLRGPFCLSGCCNALSGNVDGDLFETIDISDLSALVDFLFFGGSITSCSAEADMDISGTIDISDLQKLVDFLFFGGTLPICC